MSSCLSCLLTQYKSIHYNIITIWFSQLGINVSFQVYTNNHEVYKRCSQYFLNRRVHCGDMLLSEAPLASGNKFQKSALFAKLTKLPIISSSFVKIQRTYVTPSIEEMFTNLQKNSEANILLFLVSIVKCFYQYVSYVVDPL